MIHIDDVIDAFALTINRLEGSRTRSWLGGLCSQGDRGMEGLRVIQYRRRHFYARHRVGPEDIGYHPIRLSHPDHSRRCEVPDNYVGSTVKAAETLEFEARVTMDEGIQRLTMAYLDGTVTYLERKMETECSTARTYNISDVLLARRM